MTKPSTEIRLASQNDAQRVWQIRNTPQAQSSSINQAEIPLPQHIIWFENKYFKTQKNYCFVAEIEKYVVGYCRYDYSESGYTVSIAIDPAWHGQGVGTYLLSESWKKLHSPQPALATIRKDNPGSIRIFTKNGFVEKNTDETYLYLEKSC